MTRLRAAIGSSVFLLLAPGIVAGAIPWWLTGWHFNRYSVPAQVAGVVIVVVGVAVLLASFARFVFEGLGTPAPVAPTQQLVVGGFYRYVRNPMYLAVGASIAGQAIALGQPVLFVYLSMFAIAVVAFVSGYEEPTLQNRYGAQYEEYRRAVPGWLPRLTPWRPDP
jgi:protein-S-isoprenylcysteine O-methyltransferase Ste14